MAVTKAKKEEILAELTKKFKDAKSIVFLENKGLTVEQISNFRSDLRNKAGGSEYNLAKKTLIKKALGEIGVSEIDDAILEGAVGGVFGYEDEFSNIRITHTFGKNNDKVVIRGGVFEGKPVNAEYIIALASLPSRDELLAKLLGSMQSPISGFVGIGGGVISSFVRALSEISKKGQPA